MRLLAALGALLFGLTLGGLGLHVPGDRRSDRSR